MLSHRALLGSMNSLDEHFGTIDGGRTVSFLPFAHMGERMFSHYRGMAYGLEITSCPDPKLVVQHLIDARPQYVFSPPRLFEKIRAAIEGQIIANKDGQGPGIREAIDVGLHKVAVEQAGGIPDPDLVARWEQLRATRLKPVLAALGLDQVEVALTGSAMVPPDLVSYFLALGVPASEGWGMSELAAFGCFNSPGDVRVATCARPLPGAEIELQEDGEIFFRSPWLMTEYLNRPELTAETIDADGWLHTGDIGQWVDGRLRIIDRKKELIINSFGKNMSPANIEHAIRVATPLVAAAVAVGDARPYTTALLVLDPEVTGAQYGPDRTIAQLAADPQVRATLRDAVERANQTLTRTEQIKKFVILDQPWLPGTTEMSATMKLRRRPVMRKYADLIEDLYAEQPPESVVQVQAPRMAPTA